MDRVDTLARLRNRVLCGEGTAMLIIVSLGVAQTDAQGPCSTLWQTLLLPPTCEPAETHHTKASLFSPSTASLAHAWLRWDSLSKGRD
jgi:hypothetical protein